MKIRKIVNSLTESNGYIIYEDNGSAIVIDPCIYSEIADFIKINCLKIESVLLTHEHYDHILGLNELRENYKFKVLSSLKCNEGIQDSVINKSKTFKAYLYFLGKEDKYEEREYVCEKADIIFEKYYKFEWCGHKIELFETPGHSDGGICILINKNSLFCGDSLVYKSKVIIKAKGGNEEAYNKITIPFFKSLDKNVDVFPGHGKSFELGKVL